MRFAITHPLVTHPYHPDLVTGPGIARLAQAAEAAGFDAYGFTDHPVPSQKWLDAGGHDALDPFVALAFVAAATERLRLLPNIVVLPYRNPFVVAKAGATLDVLSGGRFTLSCGTGYLRSEFRALGVDPDERNARFDEAIDAIKAVWTGDDVTFEGEFFSAHGVTAHPRPVSQPHPPIWIGGNSAAARQRVADRGDGWAPFPAPASMAKGVGTAALDTPERLAQAIADLHRRLEANGRDPASVDICWAWHPKGPSLDHLAELGITWVQLAVPGDSVDAAVAAVERYAEVIR